MEKCRSSVGKAVEFPILGVLRDNTVSHFHLEVSDGSLVFSPPLGFIFKRAILM